MFVFLALNSVEMSLYIVFFHFYVFLECFVTLNTPNTRVAHHSKPFKIAYETTARIWELGQDGEVHWVTSVMMDSAGFT